ncbi:MAG: archease [Candidatus Eremiobacteraeota bacterium]|nr:archease [Candidatus Eremiobacteraeota bacterium]
MPHKQFEIIEHTADIGIRAFGRTREKLFENCAIGMMSIILGADYGKACDLNDAASSYFNPREEIVEVEAEDGEGLLYSFLAEILYLFEGENFIPLRFNNSKIHDRMFTTSIPGVNYDSNLFEIINEVKAVTFHRMKIEKKGDMWQTDVIFDI